MSDESISQTAKQPRLGVSGWNVANADRFRLLESQGVDPQTAWQATGTWRGADGKLRQYIPKGVSSLKGYGAPSPTAEFLGGFKGVDPRFSVMNPQAQELRQARELGEQVSVAGQLFGAAAPFAAASTVARAGQMTGISPLTVFHGSPHRFSKFESSKIGTGEGAQVYGRGLYFAENPAVAKSYQVNLSQGKDPRDWINNIAISLGKNKTTQDVISELKKYPEVAELANDQDIVNLTKQMADGYEWSRFGGETWSDNAISAMKKLDAKLPLASKGSFYTVDLPDEQIVKMLDWDKPLSQQSSYVQDALKKLPQNLKDYIGIDKDKNLKGGIDILKPLGGLIGDAKASEILRQVGIPGIRYLDEGSRGKFQVQNFIKGNPYGEPVSFATEKQAMDYAQEQAKKGFTTESIPGTKNFVVFPGEEESLTILKQE